MMKKLIILVVAIVLPLGLFAQTQKVAYINPDEIIMAMPEVAGIQQQLNDLNEQYEKEFTQLQTRFNKEYETYLAEGESLTENIRLRRMQELQEMDEKMQNFIPMANQDVQKKQQELFAPLQERLLKAIQDVGAENGFAYILHAGQMLYVGDSSIDATPLVKAKLGLQ